MLKAIDKLGFEQASPIQAEAIPVLLSGKDVVGQSQTGSGKTAAFAVPAIEKVDPTNKATQILILCPTRELAVQVCGELERIEASVRCMAIYGGDSFQNQVRRLQGFQAVGRGRNRSPMPQVVVATPGRLRDHLTQGTLDLQHLQMLVFDEADEMLEMGFRDDLDAILASLPTERQTMLVSATISPEVNHIASRHMKDPALVGISRGLELNVNITHSYFEVREVDRFNALVNLLHFETPARAVIFCHTRRDTEEVSSRLSREGFRVGYLSGDLQQAQRNMTLEGFRRGDVTLLVATDVAARGIDVQEMTHVINFNVPQAPETYVHRTGRTGRAGRNGAAWTLVAEDWGKWTRLVREIRLKAAQGRIPTRGEIQAKRSERFLTDLQARFGTASEQNPLLDEAADRLLKERDPRELVADLLGTLLAGQGGVDVGYDVTPPSPRRPGTRDRDSGSRYQRGRPMPYRSERSMPSSEPEVVKTRSRRQMGPWDGNQNPSSGTESVN